MLKKLIALPFLSAIVACASGDSGYRQGLPSDQTGNTAPGWAYGADHFVVNKKMKVRSENAYEFYYKRCELGGERPFYSKTSYECSEAPR